jgi:hypothetical protein
MVLDCIASSDNLMPPMKTSSKTLIYLILFAIFDTVIPVPITAIILIYVLLEKPDWFESLVRQIYQS